MDSLDITLSLRHEARRDKRWRDQNRNQVPPFLGDLVSIKEAMQALNRSISYVRDRIEDGRLNIWYDPVSRRVWILKDDLDILVSDLSASRRLIESGRASSRKSKPKIESKNHLIDTREQPEAIETANETASLEDEEKEREARYHRKDREYEEWYASELAKIEGRDPKEAVRQLQLERGWITPEPIGEVVDRGPRRSRSQPSRPVSWTHPRAIQRKPAKSRTIPIGKPEVTVVPSEIDRPFPMGWVTSRVACGILNVTRSSLLAYVRSGKLQRRKRPDGKDIYLYDSVALERIAEKRMGAAPSRLPNESFSHWGPRNQKMKLNEYDGWISTTEAAHILGVRRQRVVDLVRQGKLPCYQKCPGIQGSPIMVSHNMVVRLRDNPDRLKNRDAYLRGRSAQDPHEEEWEENRIEPYRLRDETANTRRDWGEYYSTRQTAHLLGISTSAVQSLRLRGRLAGHHQRAKKKGAAGKQWWFFKKEDVHNLQADPVYVRLHKRYLKQFGKIWQDDPAPEPKPAEPPNPVPSKWSWTDSDLPTW